MQLFKAFGLRKQHGDDDTNLINKLHNFWTHIEHPVLGMMEREDMHIMGVDELLHRMNVGPAKGGDTYDNHPKTGKPVPSWIPEILNRETGTGYFSTPPWTTDNLPSELAHRAGTPMPLDRTSLNAGLDNPEHWGLGEFFKAYRGKNGKDSEREKAEPTTPAWKNPHIDDFLYGMSGIDRLEAIQGQRCAFEGQGCENPNFDWVDEPSKREYSITGVCMNCQDRLGME